MKTSMKNQNFWIKNWHSKEKIDNTNVITRNFNIYFLATNRATKQKWNKSISDLKNTINHPDLIDIYGTLYPIFSYTWCVYSCNVNHSDLLRKDVCWINFIQTCVINYWQNSMLMNLQYILNKISFNRNKHKISLCIDWLMKI